MVLACSHSRSLQLLARLDARTEFEILEHSLEWKLVVHITVQLCAPSGKNIIFATVRGLAKFPPIVHSNCSERMCLYARTFLVALENSLGWPGESPWLAGGTGLKTYASSSPP